MNNSIHGGVDCDSEDCVHIIDALVALCCSGEDNTGNSERLAAILARNSICADFSRVWSHFWPLLVGDPRGAALCD